MTEQNQPQTLHKYLYAHSDHVNNIDPSGNFSLLEIGVAQDIRTTLSGIQVDVGFSFFDSAINSDNPNASDDFLGNGAFILGIAGGKIANLLSKKVKKLCQVELQIVFELS